MRRNLSLIKFFIKNGNIRGYLQLPLILCGWLIFYGCLRAATNFYLGLLGMGCGILMAMIGGYSARADSLGLKPFTNDPLGWRKARKAYEQESEQSKLDNK